MGSFAVPTKRRVQPGSVMEVNGAKISPPPPLRRVSLSKRRKQATSSCRLFILFMHALLLIVLLISGAFVVWVDPQQELSLFRRSTTATTTTTTPPLAWKNEHDIVHVIQTRFMQLQPHLLHLGRARLRLFQSITLPSIVHQSNQNFLWIIRTDPQLAVELKQQLIEAVSPYKNIILVGSNQNPEGFRTPDCIADLTKPWSGQYPAVQSYHAAAQVHVVLETRLDADDGLYWKYVDLLQADAAQHLLPKSSSSSNTNNHHHEWRVWCAYNHMEWQYASPWVNTTTTGALVGLRTKHCVTAGLTWGYAAAAAGRLRRTYKNKNNKNNNSSAALPVALSHRHQLVHEQVPECRQDNNASESELLLLFATTQSCRNAPRSLASPDVDQCRHGTHFDGWLAG